jgi:hypothetical protein
LLISKKNSDTIPANLQGFDRIEYETLVDLERQLANMLDGFLSSASVGRIPKGTGKPPGTAAYSMLPFWTEFTIWKDSITQAMEKPDAMYGEMRLIQHEGQKYLSKYMIPDRGLLIGRSDDCDVVVSDEHVSSQHFLIEKGRTGKHFIRDLHSKNGTFHNGYRMLADEAKELNFCDKITIPGARFILWDERPLPRGLGGQVPGDTGVLTGLLQIDIPDLSPPSYLSTLDHTMILTVLLPDGSRQFMLEVQGYYPLDRILSEFVRLIGLPEKKYHFRIRNELLRDEETLFALGVKSHSLMQIVPEP